MTAILYNWFQEIEAEGTLSNSFNETNLTLISKPHEEIKRKENYGTECV